MYFNVNLKLLTKLINSAFVGEWTMFEAFCLYFLMSLLEDSFVTV